LNINDNNWKTVDVWLHINKVANEILTCSDKDGQPLNQKNSNSGKIFVNKCKLVWPTNKLWLDPCSYFVSTSNKNSFTEDFVLPIEMFMFVKIWVDVLLKMHFSIGAKICILFYFSLDLRFLSKTQYSSTKVEKIHDLSKIRLTAGVEKTVLFRSAVNKSCLICLFPLFSKKACLFIIVI
jgi:hypothetical protein